MLPVVTEQTVVFDRGFGEGGSFPVLLSTNAGRTRNDVVNSCAHPVQIAAQSDSPDARCQTMDLSPVKLYRLLRRTTDAEISRPPDALVPQGVGDHLFWRRGNFRRSWQPSLTLGWGGRRWKFPFAIKTPE